MPPGAHGHRRPAGRIGDTRVSSSLPGEDRAPVVLHADHRPAAGSGFVETLVEAADQSLSVVRVLVVRVEGGRGRGSGRAAGLQTEAQSDQCDDGIGVFQALQTFVWVAVGALGHEIDEGPDRRNGPGAPRHISGDSAPESWARRCGRLRGMERDASEGCRANDDVDVLLQEILEDAHGDDEQLGALSLAFEDVGLPADAFVLGEPVSVTGVDYDGNVRRGLTATCRREDGGIHVVTLADLRFAEVRDASRCLAAYRQWLNLDPVPPGSAPGSKPLRHKVTDEDIDLDRPVELIALVVKERVARCRLLGSERMITLRAAGLWNVTPGQIVTVEPRKQWRYGGHPYLSGEIKNTRIDVPALGLVPLRLEEFGEWDPADHDWGDEGEGPAEWAAPIIAAGPRPQFEMEQVLPGDDPHDRDGDPILESNALKARGEVDAAHEILVGMLDADLRSLDAHVHLGNFSFETSPRKANGHYEVGFRIGESSLGEGFCGVLPWGLIDNRPYLRCVHSYALCCWRLGEHDEAASLFERMLWLNPTDNQGARSLLPAVRAGESWDARREYA